MTDKNNLSLSLILLCLFCIFETKAKTTVRKFDHSGKIRAIISESKTYDSYRENPLQELGLKISDEPTTRIDFYFTYYDLHTNSKGEQWLKLPKDRNWSPFLNQTIQISADLNGESLTNVKVKSNSEINSTFTPTFGIHKVVTVPLTIQPPSSPPETNTVTTEAVRNVLFNQPKSVNKFYQEASYRKFGFTGLIHPQGDVVPMTIQANVAGDCQNRIITEITPIVRQRLLEQGFDTTNGNIDLGFIIFNDLPGCPNYPFATRGSLGARGIPNWLWMPVSWFETGAAIIAHEIGHTLGGNHPVAVRCVDFNNNDTCVITPDADDRDFMSFGGSYYLMPNNYERKRWGWHPPDVLSNEIVNSLNSFDLFTPVLTTIKDRKKRGRFLFKYLSGNYSGGWAVYPESRGNFGEFERYTIADQDYIAGITLRIGHADFTNAEAFSVILENNSTPTLADAPLRLNERLTIGGVLLECKREYIPQLGARISFSPVN